MARITFNTMYNTTMRGLQNNAGKLNKLEEQISSEQKINRPSDHPIDFTNALRYGNTIDKLNQQHRNINDAEIYLTILENTHDKMNSIFGRCQALAVDLSNDTENHDQRLYGNLEVRNLLEELVALSQTRHKDGYVFSGKWSDQPPYEIKTGAAIYEVSNTIAASVRDVVSTNLSLGLRAFENTPPITITLLDGNYKDPNLAMDKNLPGEGPGLPGTPHYTNPNRNPIVERIIPSSVAGLADLREYPQYDEKGSPFDENGVPYADYRIDYVTGELILLSEKAKGAFFNDSTTGTPGEQLFSYDFSRTPPETGTAPTMSFDYIYRNSIDMSGDIYREIDTGITIKINADPNDLFGKGGLGGVGSANTDSFKEIISLMQGLWYNEQPQIANGIETVGAAAERNLAEQATEGARLNRLAIVKDRNEESKIANTDALSIIQDVDVAEALTQFSLAQAVYNASLYATSNLLQRSLMDYL